MPEITVSDDQLTYLDTLREELAAEHAGPYGTVRRQDVLQYLIDNHEGEIDETVGDPDAETSAESETGDGAESATENDAETESTAENDEDRLNAMMNLLETHADKWEEADGDDGRYAVELPDGEVEHVRTKDDVRAVLFKNY